jgi:hypothetical protein
LNRRIHEQYLKSEGKNKIKENKIGQLYWRLDRASFEVIITHKIIE